MSEWTDQDIENYYEAHPELRPTKVDFGWKKSKENKHRAVRTDGYASKKEAKFAAQLALRQKAGEVWFWLEQVPFKLPGGAKHRVDFLVFYSLPEDVEMETPIPSWELVEVKGRDLALGKLKRKQVSEIYGVEITVF